MSKFLFTFLIVQSCVAFQCFAQDKDVVTVKAIMAAQQSAWNEGSVEGFMEGYWRSDSLLFISKEEVSYGYDSAMENYKRSYPDATAMGKLTFDIMQVRKLSARNIWVLGKWTLTREKDHPGGHFTLLFEKIKGRWVIVADHTS